MAVLGLTRDSIATPPQRSGACSMAAQHPEVMDFMPQAVRCLFDGVQKTWFFGCLDASRSPNAAKSWDDPVPTPRPPPYGGLPGHNFRPGL